MFNSCDILQELCRSYLLVNNIFLSIFYWANWYYKYFNHVKWTDNTITACHLKHTIKLKLLMNKTSKKVKKQTVVKGRYRNVLFVFIFNRKLTETYFGMSKCICLTLNQQRFNCKDRILSHTHILIVKHTIMFRTILTIWTKMKQNETNYSSKIMWLIITLQSYESLNSSR